MDVSGWVNRASTFLFFAIVALAPLPFGSVDQTAVAFWCVALGIAAVTMRTGALRPDHYALLAGIGILVATYFIVVVIQLLARPSGSPLWEQAAQALGTAIPPAASVVRDLPVFALGAPLAAILSLICGVVICADRERALLLLRIVAWAGAAYAAFGIASFLIDPTKLLWREKQSYTTVLTATFVNRNTAAAYFGSVGVIWLLQLCARIRSHFGNSEFRWALIPTILLSHTSRGMLLPLGMVFLCLGAMFLTGSRAGIVISLAAMLFAALIFFRRHLPGRSAVFLFIGIGSGIALLLLHVLGSGVSGRFDEQGITDYGRFGTYQATWRMILDYPLLGTGLGTFAWIYPSYRGSDISMWGVWTRAHNTLLEIASDLGLPLTLLVIAAWVGALAVLVHGIKVRRRTAIVPIAALAVALLAALHSLIDFSLQIPGYTIVVFALMGAGLAQSFRDEGPQSLTVAAPDAAGARKSSRSTMMRGGDGRSRAEGARMQDRSRRRRPPGS